MLVRTLAFQFLFDFDNQFLEDQPIQTEEIALWHLLCIDDAETVELGLPEFVDTGVDGLLLTGVE